MKHIYLTLVLAFCSVALVFANPVTPERAREVATHFWAQNNTQNPSVTLNDVTGETDFHNIYIFTTGDNLGFVVVAGDDKALPILGYSFTSPVRTDSLPENFACWMKGTGKYIAWIAKQDDEQSAEVARQWMSLSSEIASNAPAIVNVVNALLTTTWDQGAYYYKMCPSDNSGRCYTGCTATATAQVMKYHNHPTTGHGSHSYTWNNQTLSADFANTTYLWSMMPNALGSSSTSAQDDAVATLMYHVGVACNMQYSSSGSGASAISYNTPTYACAENALRNYFKYDWGLHSVEYSDFADAEWKALLKSELNNSRPIIYTGFDTSAGHCFVCDGYNSSNHFHFNWGWGGYYDGFYAIGQLNPGSGTGGTSSGTYNIDNQAVVGIKPNANEGASSTLNYSVNNAAYGSVTIEEGSTSMTSYTTETKLYASANEGYRFTGWSDGCHYNSRTFMGNGGSYSVTANFAPCGGDTAYYCFNGPTGYGYMGSGTHYYGIRIPASQLRANDSIRSVMIYCEEANTYTIKIYSGGTTAPGTLIATTTASVANEGWKTVALTNRTAINASQPLWIVVNFTNSDGYGVPYTYSAGNPDDAWYGGTNGTSWQTMEAKGYHRAFLIKAIFYTDLTNLCTLTGNSYPVGAGSVDGAGTYNRGDEATIYAIATPGYKFTGWEDGGMDQPRTVTMTGNQTVTANFTPIDGDTLTYSVTDEYQNAIGTGSAYTIYWGIKLDTCVLRPNRQVTAIQLYDVSSATTSMFIYKGGKNAPGTKVKSYTGVTTTAANRYNTYSLPTPLKIDNTQPLWIVFKNEDSSTHPCAYTNYSGNNNGCYISVGSFNSWESLTDEDFYVSWMIKVITSDYTGTDVEEIDYYASNVFVEGLNINVVIPNENASVRIFDTTGRLVVSERQTDSRASYAMPVAGIYYVVVDNATTKVVVR